MSVIHIIQKEVNKIQTEKWKEDVECPPTFVLSLLEGSRIKSGKIESNHEILLTVTHNSTSISRVIFPIPTNKYGYESLEQEMEWLYNSTM